MKGLSPDQNQPSFLSPMLRDQLNPKHPLCLLSEKMPWDALEKELSLYYSKRGQRAKPIRLMVSLLILKQLHNLSDESVVARWVENPYYQFFSGETVFQWKFPIHPTDLVYFRKRIGKLGVEKIFQVSIELHGKKAKEKEVLIDSTVQEKNITFPTDSKLYIKIIKHCVKIAEKEGVVLRQNYRLTVKKHLLDLRFMHHPKNRKKARSAVKKLKTIAGRLIRELHRKLDPFTLVNYLEQLALFERVLHQQKKDSNKIYSIHEPETYCISKGKEHKKYEFGAKASIVLTKNNGIIVGACSHDQNQYDGHTLPEVLEQTTRLIGREPKVAICDRGYRGTSFVGNTQIVIPKPPGKRSTAYQKQKARKRFRRRAGIEPVIGHLKSDYRMARNFLKGSIGDSLNVMLAAAAFNFNKLMKELSSSFVQIFLAIARRIWPFCGQSSYFLS
jgi:IS5 family transposase